MGFIGSHIRKLNMLMSLHLDGAGFFEKLGICIDMGYCIIRYGCGINDYFGYRFYAKKADERKTFIVYSKRMYIIKSCNDKSAMEVFDRKEQFFCQYHDFMNRDFLVIDKSDIEEFKNFAQNNKRFVIKPCEGSHGLGVKLINVSDYDSTQALYDELKGHDYLAEGYITQHKSLAEFNPGTVNTLRIVTLLLPNGEADVKCAVVRFGVGEHTADNFHHGGIAAVLDTKTGEVTSRAVDKQLRFYDTHPTSGLPVKGYVVPNWNEVLDVVKSAAKADSRVRYVGWDVAIDESGRPVIIEGNAKADPDITQMPDQVGKYPLFERDVEEIRKVR